VRKSALDLEKGLWVFIGGVMTANVVTIPRSTSLADATRIIDAHRIRSLASF
jgi:CBS domain-containing protein